MRTRSGVGAALLILWAVVSAANAAEKTTEVNNTDLLACFQATQDIFFDAGDDIGPGVNLMRYDRKDTKKPLVFIPRANPEGFFLYTENQVFAVDLPWKAKQGPLREWKVKFSLPDRGPYVCEYRGIDPEIPAKRSPVWKYVSWANPEREADRTRFPCTWTGDMEPTKNKYDDVSKRLKPLKDHADTLQYDLKQSVAARLEKLTRIFRWEAARYRKQLKEFADGEKRAADHRKSGIISVDRIFAGGKPPSKPDRAAIQQILHGCLYHADGSARGLAEDTNFRERVQSALRELNSESLPTYDPETYQCR